jgi:hypothetical protein
MSVSSISNSYSYYQTANNHHQRKQEFDALSEALQSGNLSGAQQAFGQLQQNAPGNSQSGADGGIVADISALGQALASNDLSGAQNAFSTLQSDFQNAPPPPPPGESGGGKDGGQVQEAFSDLASALQNGDLDAAQTAFATLQSLAPDNQADSSSASTGGTSADSTGSSQINSDFASLGEALQSGDVSNAQNLFDKLLSDLQANAPRHHGAQQYQQDAATTTSSNVSVSA